MNNESSINKRLIYGLTGLFFNLLLVLGAIGAIGSVFDVIFGHLSRAVSDLIISGSLIGFALFVRSELKRLRLDQTGLITRPLGITILGLIYILGPCSSFAFLLKATPYPFFGKMYTGTTAYLVAGVSGLIDIFIGVGLLKLKRYAWWAFLAYSCFSLFNFIINRFTTTQTIKYPILDIFVQSSVLAIIALTTVYIFKKRSYFK
jgi:hypothetical protein